MNLMNVANCTNPDSLFNTGVPPCDVKRQKIRGIIFLDKGVYFTPADMATVASFIAALKTKTTAPRGQRAYPMFDLLNFADGTAEPATGGVGNLSTATFMVNEAVPVFTYGYDGSEARHKTMSAMLSSSLDMMLVDAGWAVYGCCTDGTNLKGYSVLQLYPYIPKFVVADSVDQYHFRATLSNITEYREQSAYFVANSGLVNVQGLINFKLMELSHTTNVYKIQAIADGGTSMGILYGATLAAMTFTAKDLDNNNATIAITSVAYDATLDALTVTFDSTAWPALPSGHRIQLSPPIASVLSTGGIKPYEGFSVIITKP